MTRIILVRHGQTRWNTGTERFRGRSDIALDETGVKQAEATARELSRWQVAAVYSSPQRRALQTAEYIARACNLPVQPLDGLIDMDFGEWQGLSLEEAQARDGELYRLWLDHPHRVTFPGGESLEQVRARLTLTLKDLCARHPEQSIVLVSHKVICKVLLCLLLGLDNSYFWRVEKDTCAISIIEMRHTVPRITLLNDTCHLKGLS